MKNSSLHIPSIKHKAWDEVNQMLDGKLTPYIQRVIDGEMTAKALANAYVLAVRLLDIIIGGKKK